MEWTYSDPSASAKDAVRLSIGDTNEAAPLLFDQEIQFFLDSNNQNVSAAALLSVEAIIAKLSTLCDESVGSVSKSFSQMRDGFYKLRDNLKTRAAYRGGVPFAGGISRTQVQLTARDRDRVQPLFSNKPLGAADARGRDWPLTGVLSTGLPDNSPIFEDWDI
ncbi:MAG: hypothetical protein EOO38_00030 [Cytophagaceae bacterium]|nr:MAG: hypothetical protein EOO38_00030 [Cytophagaceae bacterium]